MWSYGPTIRACGKQPAVSFRIPMVATAARAKVFGSGTKKLDFRILLIAVATKPGMTV